MRHLISPLDFTVEETYEVLDFADRIAANPKAYAHAADGRQLATLFYEPSTRTRLSFESAMLSLGGQTIGFAGADQSSVSKGETIADTVRVVSCYADIIVMRHPKEGAPLCAFMYSKIPVINAGDGGHNHPTQTLIDLMTIRQRLGRLDNLTIGFCGDLKFGRMVHSLVKTIGFAGADQSSVSKGETIADTVRVVSCYADIIVMRHPKEGAPLCAFMYSKIPVINAGDGGHNHPTQTLIDLMTIRQRLGRLDNLTIGFCGDLKFGRTVHSLVKSLVRHTGNKFYFISPEELRIPDYLVDETLEPTHTPYEEVSSLEDSLPKLDVLYMTRVQKERFFNEEDYIRLKDTYILNREKLQLAKEDMPVLHPLPRVDEIAYDVDDDSRAAYFQQVQNGKYMRMALILSLLGIEDPQTGEKILELGES